MHKNMVTQSVYDPSHPRAQVAGRLDTIEVEDFKSYKGLHVIGPFKNFTAVIGPNGSGKSNLMDAVSFVCGVKTAQLRANLEELLYRNTASNLPEDRPRKGRVSLVFQKTNGTVIKFTRAILPSSASDNATYTSRYKVDETTVSTDDFMKSLLDLGINTKARNFLVFQGDIEKVAQKSAKDLAAFFEVISGSDAYAQQHDQLSEQVEQAEAKVAVLYQKHKALRARKRTMKQAKEEAESYLAETQMLEAKKREHILWKLFHVRHDYIEAAEIKAEYDGKLEELLLKHAADREALVDADRHLASLRKQRVQLMRELDKLQEQKDRQNPAMIKVKEMLARKNREFGVKQDQLVGKQANLDSAKASLKTRTDNLKTLQEQLKRIDADIETRIGSGINMSPAQLQEYRELKLQAEQKVFEAAAALRKEQDKLKGEQASLSSVVTQLEAMCAQRDKLRKEVTEMEARRQDACEKEKAGKEQVMTLNKDVKELQGESRSTAAKRAQYKQQLDDIEARVQTLSSQYQTSRKERKMAETVSKLMDMFPDDVFGRLSDICQIGNKKYNTAIAVLMGRHMDSVVVRSMARVNECIKYLKAERREPMEFIPLDRIQATEPSEKLRHLGGTAKLGVDLIQCPDHLKNAVVFALGNALVADTLAEAKQLGFDLRHKVCVVDGTLIAVNGSMSGGTSRSFADRSTRFDQGAVEALKRDRDAALSRLDALPDEHELYDRESRKKRDVQAAQMDLNSAQAELQSLNGLLKSKGVELQNVEAGVAAKEPTVAKLQRVVDVLQADVEKQEKAINRVKDHMFKEFSKKVGIKNVREYEAKIERETQEHEQRRSTMRRQIAELQSSVEGLERSIQELNVKIANDEADLEKIKGEVTAIETDKQKLRKKTSGLDEQLADKRDDLEEVKVKEADASKRVKGAKSAQSKFTAAEENLNRAISRQQAAMARLVDSAKGVLQDAMLASVNLEPAEDAGHVNNTQAVDDDEQPVELPEELRYRFDSLRSGLQRTIDDGARQRTDAELSKAIDELQKELEATVPNLKAPDEYAELLKEEEALKQEMDAAKAAERDVQERFSDVREARTGLFNAAFDHVSSRIDVVYKALTRSAVNTMGGTAYLSKEQDEQPYNGGVKFSAIPPSKRFRDMEQLSGGEKTLAALALLMAVHSYKPSPFFVLDEVDAALDARNLSRVAHYIRACTADDSPHPFQGIVISLKDIFFEKADALVGVTRDWSHTSSQVFTHSLEGFGEPEL